VVLVTHETEIAAHTHRQVLLRDGKVVSDRRRGEAPAPPAPPPVRD
jgi:ABC-type lipoprotein export system ATPase subunit